MLQSKEVGFFDICRFIWYQADILTVLMQVGGSRAYFRTLLVKYASLVIGTGLLFRFPVLRRFLILPAAVILQNVQGRTFIKLI